MTTSRRKDYPVWVRWIASLWTWCAIIVITVLVSGLSIFTVLPFSFLFDKTRLWMHWVCKVWAYLIMSACPFWNVSIEGKENIQKGKTYVVVANHQSLVDIFVLLPWIPLHFKFMAKKELFKVPFMGWSMFFAGYIAIDRASHESGKSAILRSMQWVKRGVSVLFFPEGTRSVDGQIKDFKLGAFKLAQETGAEILPVIIDGTSDAIPKKGRLLQSSPRFWISVGKPVRPEGEIADLKNRVRADMIAHLDQLRSRKR